MHSLRTAFLTSSLAFLISQPLHALDNPRFCSVKLTFGASSVDSIRCLYRGGTLFAGIGRLVELEGGSNQVAGGVLTTTCPLKTIQFTAGSPYAKLSDGALWQFPAPIEHISGEFFAETKSLIRLLNSCSNNEIIFDAGKPQFSVRFEKPAPNPNDDRKRWALDLVVIDPGHGGKDPGAVGATGLKEKDVTLDVALRLNKFLQKENIKTVMTRDKDEFIALSERTSIANKSGGKLFLSLHCNSARQRKAQGMETYFLAPSKTERATEAALVENEVIKFEDRQDRYQELTEESYILMTMTQATFTQESESLAGLVQETVSRKAGLRDRGVDQAGFYVLIGASMPSILFEIAFISNKEEEKKLKDKKFRQKIADEVGRAILKFLADQEKPPGH